MDQSHARWREVADNLRERFRDVAELMDEAEHDVLAYLVLDESLRSKLHRTNPRALKIAQTPFGLVGLFQFRCLPKGAADSGLKLGIKPVDEVARVVDLAALDRDMGV